MWNSRPIWVICGSIITRASTDDAIPDDESIVHLAIALEHREYDLTESITQNLPRQQQLVGRTLIQIMECYQGDLIPCL
jgi:hypothetical protein